MKTMMLARAWITVMWPNHTTTPQTTMTIPIRMLKTQQSAAGEHAAAAYCPEATLGADDPLDASD